MSENSQEIPYRFVSPQTYAELSTQAGFKITCSAVKARIENGTINTTEIDGVEGYFIDILEHPFQIYRRGPKHKRTPKK